MALLHRLLIFVLALVLSAAAHAGDRVALVIGVSSYRTIPSLANPSRDAAAVATALRGVGFEVTQLNQPAQLTRDAIGTALVRFRAQAERAEAAIVYFAGHGVEVDGANWLLPSDVTADSPDDLEVKAIPASSAINAVRGASAIRLVILDACRDNPFAANPGWASGKRAFGSRGLGRELGRADNVVLLLATQPGTRASDGMGALNSPFARALAATLDTQGMQIAELPTMVSRRMRQDDRVEQRPDQQGIFDEPRWMFRPGGVTGGPSTGTMPVQNIVRPAPQPQSGDNAAALIAECERLTSVALEQVLPAMAIPACTKAVQAAPGNANMLAGLGYALEKAGDYSRSRGWYEQAAVLGNRVAMYNLGQFYRAGRGVAQDYAQARSWYEQSAAKGYDSAMVQLGLLYYNGQGVTVDYAQANRWYEQAAAKGNFSAMYNLGQNYRLGKGVTQDYAQARSWYEQSAAKGYDDAMLQLGLLYYNGQGVTVDYVQANRWYEQAAAKGNFWAMYNLGQNYRAGKGMTQDYAQARSWYEQSAAKGYSDAMVRLGELYYNGQGVTTDYVQANRWFEQAAAKGNDDAMNWLGFLYEEGQGVPQDQARANRWYEQAAAKGNATAMYNLGQNYRLGRGVTQDLAQARRWYEQSAAKGYENARKRLAEMSQ